MSNETKIQLQNELAKFTRSKEYLIKEELGSGACGKTVLLYDSQIDRHFVCKKFHPYEESERAELFNGFMREIGLLFEAYHPNVVRIFSHFSYPDRHAGYIIMEHIDGLTIDAYIQANPEKVNDLFIQAIEGFAYLESIGVLHRDIRSTNILVTRSGQLKIIDLGFGKRASSSKDYEKSITLNWAASTPQDFRSGRYDFTTEVYFLGKLFQDVISSNLIFDFRYDDLLAQMCEQDPRQRTPSFEEAGRRINSSRLEESEFSPEAVLIYRAFAEALDSSISKIDVSATFNDDIDDVKTRLEAVYRTAMLEEHIPVSSTLINVFIKGTYYYYSNRNDIKTTAVKNFVRLLGKASEAERRIILSNIYTKLDAKTKFNKITEDDIPF